ncbi:type III-A CRISPR-associated RAMP protein Csm5 [Enterococcus xiangfangensis]|uniref:CRISPR system Cms protein Csm5 n=1 Tax=Enterococcus xiangfangensis TaxID=1296537 RepID=A0ABU3FDS7_9ENTE|nr:type III-A CRISPR-associated RAMP protein Csm5 [Enterococcus xiangfangensis]MDT2760811.1 type III-A CRISPR-associated RAMP protein Csm5 [Enterococcus xiangfangensis]
MSYKKYLVTLTTYGPVHIGCGTVVRKQEYIYDQHKSLVHIVDGPKLTKYLSRNKKLDAFLDDITKYQKNADLKRFLDSQKINHEDWKDFVINTERVNQGKIERNINTNRRQPATNRPLNDLHTFVRDGQNTVYVPGSSLKGALRTMILKNINEDNHKNSLFNKIKVSDSLPISNDNLAIYQKIDINKESKPMPLYRECIEVGTKIYFTLTIEDDAIRIEEIEKSIQDFYINYWNKWFIGFASTHGGKEFITNKGVPRVLLGKNRPQVVFLGGGTGFVSKTLQYQMYPKEKAKKEVFQVLQRKFRRTYGKMRETPQNVPIALKATVDYSKNKWYQQGACLIKFEEK